jgi:hypothetical protein
MAEYGYWNMKWNVCKKKQYITFSSNGADAVVLFLVGAFIGSFAWCLRRSEQKSVGYAVECYAAFSRLDLFYDTRRLCGQTRVGDSPPLSPPRPLDRNLSFFCYGERERSESQGRDGIFGIYESLSASGAAWILRASGPVCGESSPFRQ